MSCILRKRENMYLLQNYEFDSKIMWIFLTHDGCIFFSCSIYTMYLVKNGTWIPLRLFDGSLVENEFKSDGNPIIFWANVMEIP